MKPVVLVTLWASEALGAGSVKLLRMGEQVEQNPMTVTVMFGFVVFLTIAIESIKHKFEHRVHGDDREGGIEAVTVQLMIIGIVSALLISAAELGLTEVRLPWGGCESSGSGSGDNVTEVCGIGFDLQLFEFTRIVLFFMGIAYCVFIFTGFNYRDKMFKSISELERFTLASWAARCESPSVTYLQRKFSRWATRILLVRRAIVLNNQETIHLLCDDEVIRMRRELAETQGKPLKLSMPNVQNSSRFFNMAEYVKVSISASITELLHPPWFVWCSVLLLTAQTSLVKKFSGANQADTMAYTAFMSPVASFILFIFLKKKYKAFENGIVGHPKLFSSEYHFALQHPDTPADLVPRYTVSYPMGKAWHEGTGVNPWESLRTGSECYPKQKTVTYIIQVIIFCNCFYIGMLILLSGVVAEQGKALLAICWLAPLVSLGYLVPQCILYYTLIFKSETPERLWLRRALEHNGPPEMGLVDVPDSDDDGIPMENMEKTGSLSYCPSGVEGESQELEEALLSTTKMSENEVGLPPPLPQFRRTRGASRMRARSPHFLSPRQAYQAPDINDPNILSPIADSLSPLDAHTMQPFPGHRRRRNSISSHNALPLAFTPPVRPVSPASARPSTPPRTPSPGAYKRRHPLLSY